MNPKSKRVVAPVSPVAGVPRADGFPLSQLGDLLARGPQLAAGDRKRMDQDVRAVRSGRRAKADPQCDRLQDIRGVKLEVFSGP